MVNETDWKEIKAEVLKMKYTRSLVILAVIFGIGCTPPPEFRQNSVEIKKRELQSLGEDEQFASGQLEDIGSFLVAAFGTPDAPEFPGLIDAEPEDAVVTQEHLDSAAGPVASLENGVAQGLYREHCVHCHGITGDGSGPTSAFLNPYPRDFRLGKFKYKSTPLNIPPTHEDLKRILVNGIPNTAMPSFRRLSDEELDALVDYVKYLTIRGRTERDLLSILAEDPDPALDLIATEAQFEAADIAIEEAAEKGEEEPFPPLFGAADVVDEVILPQVDHWLGAIDSVTEVPERPEELSPGHPDRDVWIARGKNLFYTTGTCAQCHGQLGLGDGQVDDYDDWTKDWMKELGIDPNDHEKIQNFVDLGAMPPRNLIPRNLRLGTYRGGARPVDLYLRIKNGIEGTPMPAAPVTLTSDDIWSLVEYVRQLPRESLSQPKIQQPVNERAPR